MEYKRIENLIEKYEAGQTTLEEEKELKRFFQAQTEVPEHLQVYQMQFGYFQTAQKQRLADAHFEQNLDKLIQVKAENQTPQGKRAFIPLRSSSARWGLGIAASLLLFTLGWMLGRGWPDGNTHPAQDRLGKIDQRMESMQQMLMLSLLKQPSASERIKGVSLSYEVGEDQPEIIDALIETLNTDENTNVRLAAANALFTFQELPKVKSALIASLKVQEDPAVQIALINMMIAFKAKEAKETIQEFLEKEEKMPPPVKEKIREDLKSL